MDREVSSLQQTELAAIHLRISRGKLKLVTSNIFVYCLSKKSCNLYSKLQNKMGQDVLDI